MSKKTIIHFLLSTIFLSFSIATPSIIINKQNYVIDEIDKQIPLKIYRLEWMRFTERKNWLDKTLLDMDALRQKAPVPDLLKKQVEDRIKISQREIEAYYEKYKKYMNGRSIDQTTAHIKRQIQNNKKAHYYEEYLAKLYKRYKVKMNIPNPNPIEIIDNPISVYSKGPSDAPVTITVFSDFECTSCAYFYELLTDIFEKNKKKLRIVYRHDALDNHKYSRKAAIAATCAGEQGKFFEYSAYVYNNQHFLEDNNLLNYAKRIDLELPLFEQCLKSDKAAAILAEDMREVNRLGVERTPAVFINGHFPDKVPSPREVQKMIDEVTKN